MAETEQQEYTPVAINSRIETEEVLGNLPENWEKAPWGKTGRYFYVDHNTKSTTWVDPRTYHLRKHDIRDIVAGELPYAWEEAFDSKCGIYYIDHITQAHFLDAPWEDHVKEQVLELNSKLAEESKQLDEQLKLEQEKKAELESAEARLNNLEQERNRIDEEIQALQGQQLVGEDEEQVEKLQQEETNLKEELENVDQRIEQERIECERVAGEHARLQQEIEEFQARLKELRAVNDRLENENQELLDKAQEENVNIDEMRNLIEMEAAQRTALEQYIKQLKNEVLQLYNPEEASAIKDKEAEEAANAEHVIVDAPIPQPGELESDQEYNTLQARLEEERQERERLKELTQTLERERSKVQIESDNDGLYALPEWIKELNVQSTGENSTIRVKVSKDPDSMGFKDKLLKFEAEAIESGEEPKAPAAVGEENSFQLVDDNAVVQQEGDIQLSES